MTEERNYRPGKDEHYPGAYTVFRDDSGAWCWIWGGDGEDDEVGRSYSTRADCLRGIAQDWEATGSLSFSDRSSRFASMMRGLATREEKRRDRSA